MGLDGVARESAAVASCALALERPATVWAHPVRKWLKRGLLRRKLHCPSSPFSGPVMKEETWAVRKY